MEVHHHPDLHHTSKKWKEYFLECVMIFLAVTMGFFAESLREHLADQSREKEYIRSLVEDLKSDQAVLTQQLSYLNAGLLMMDSVITILHSPETISGHTGQLYFLARLGPRLQPLSNNSRTFDQLKNSGSFRIIRDLKTSNKIMSYYETFPLVHLLETINETEFTSYKNVVAKVFQAQELRKLEGKGQEIMRPVSNPPLRSTDNELLQELAVFAVYLHGTKSGIMGADQKIKDAGADLIAYLQKTYHLDDETR